MEHRLCYYEVSALTTKADELWLTSPTHPRCTGFWPWRLHRPVNRFFRGTPNVKAHFCARHSSSHVNLQDIFIPTASRPAMRPIQQTQWIQVALFWRLDGWGWGQCDWSLKTLTASHQCRGYEWVHVSSRLEGAALNCTQTTAAASVVRDNWGRTDRPSDCSGVCCSW